MLWLGDVELPGHMHLLHFLHSCRHGFYTDCVKTQADFPERKPRKSVAFSEGTTIVDSNGDVTESGEVNGDKESAESHAAGELTLAQREITS